MPNVAPTEIEQQLSPRGKLRAVQLKKLQPGMHSDGGGLYIDVQESGSRSWILRTTVRGKRKEIGLGGLATKSLSEARQEASELRSRAKKGEDILESRRIEKRPVPTFKDAAIAYHTQIKQTFSSVKHSRNWFRSLEQYVFPIIGSMTVDAIETADVLRAVGPIWSRIPDTAQRTLRRVKTIFDHCQTEGYRNVMVGNVAVPLPNPCDGIRKALPNGQRRERHHEALPYQKLPEFIESVRTSGSSLSVKLAVEFLVLTGSRTSDVLQLRWEELDLEGRVWSVPAHRIRMDKPHKVPLSSRAVEILGLARQFNESEFVFPGRPGQPLSNMALLMLLRRMGYESLTVHGFRATFKTWAEERTTFDSLVIEASLAQKVEGIERHYLQTTFFDKRKSLMDSWAAFAFGGRARPFLTGTFLVGGSGLMRRS